MVDLARVAGRLVGVPLAGLARLRSGKPMHPRGAVFSGVLERHGSGSGDGWGVPWLDTAATEDAVVRLSRGAGLPAPLPDLLGLALRLPRIPGRRSTCSCRPPGGARSPGCCRRRGGTPRPSTPRSWDTAPTPARSGSRPCRRTTASRRSRAARRDRRPGRGVVHPRRRARPGPLGALRAVDAAGGRRAAGSLDPVRRGAPPAPGAGPGRPDGPVPGAGIREGPRCGEG